MKQLSLLVLILGIILVTSSCQEPIDPERKPPVVVKPPEPPKPPVLKEPVLTITQSPLGTVAWGQSATITIIAENAKFFWEGDSVTTASFKLTQLLSDTTLQVTANGYKPITKQHTVAVSTPTAYERDIVGAWKPVTRYVYDKIDPSVMGPDAKFEWGGPNTFDNCSGLLHHYSSDKRVRWEHPCDEFANGLSKTQNTPYVIKPDSAGRMALYDESALSGDPSLIYYPRVIEKLTSDTLVFLQEVKPHLVDDPLRPRTFRTIYIKTNTNPYMFD